MVRTIYCPKGHNKNEVGRTVHGNCILCQREATRLWRKLHPESCREASRKCKVKRREKDKPVKRNWQLQKYFGITLNEYNLLLLKQGNCCAICKKDQSDFKKALAVDHNHTTGKNRGLLCVDCNTRVLVTVEKFPNLIKQALNYLESYNGQ